MIDTIGKTAGSAGRARAAGLPGALASEWTKLWTVRSTWACLVAAGLLGALYPLIIGFTSRSQAAAGVADPVIMSASEAAASGIMIIGQLALLTLATLAIAAEYATGSIQPTLACVPVRQRLLLAKGLVLLPVLFVAGVGMTGLGTAVAVVATGPAGQVPASGEVIRTMLGAGSYLGLLGFVVVGLGAIIRSVAGTVAVGLLLALLLPMMLDQSGVAILGTIASGLPGAAGLVLVAGDGAGRYGPAGALVVMATWAVASQLAAGLVMRGRDG